MILGFGPAVWETPVLYGRFHFRSWQKWPAKPTGLFNKTSQLLKLFK